jgi:hypothetical protein
LRSDAATTNNATAARTTTPMIKAIMTFPL